ncbi:ubiquinol-cytochrome C chaperone family protein [Hyphomonas sp.]|uniref:ubiquinol-cytochrome C chaperone family protein n=1 Tax=Hyphomonas sp. TaxID=87 RepID=UPI0039194297
MVFSGLGFRRRAAVSAAAAEAAARAFRQAREPDWYLKHAVPDTFEGRARLVTLFSALAIARLARIGGRDAAELSSRLNQRILDGFDAAFREKGVGDASIARKVRKLAEGHSGIGRAVVAALAEADGPDSGALAAIVHRNGLCVPGHEAGLSDALAGVFAALLAQPDSEVLAGQFAFGGTGG